MQIPRKYIDNYVNAINVLTDDAREKLKKSLERVDLTDVSLAREAIIQIMEMYCGSYTDTAAVLASEFYDGLREMQVGIRIGAVADSRRNPEATVGAVRAFMQDVVDGKPYEVFEGKLLDRVDAEIRLAANECVAYNADRDKLKVKYARVPSGSETCQFCIMLASRGAVYKSKETASHAHANCDCKVVPDFGDGIEGYEPDLYYDMWKHPEKYPELREAINARRRELYASRKKYGIGAVYSDVYKARDNEVANANLNKLKQTQLVHIEGTNQNKNAESSRGRKPSCFTISLEEVHELIKKHAGHGVPDRLDNYKWNRKENCTANRVVGYTYSIDGKTKIKTRCFKIHYSDNGVHAVPRYDDGGEPDDV